MVLLTFYYFSIFLFIQKAPTLERSPEVFHVLNEMNKTGVDIFVDVHGDEELPFNFIVGNQGLSSWDDRMEALHGAFLGAYCRANSDMQKCISYPTPPKASGRANLSLASKQVGHRFNCLAVTLEMPFKDCLTNPDPIRGWSPDRSMKLGESLLDALVYVQPYLRADGVGLETFPSEDDAYVHPASYYSTL
jgi:murein tripeptide amidase MpaA